MPSGGRQLLFGDLCKGCQEPLTESNGVIISHRLKSWCKFCHKTRIKEYQSRTKEVRAQNWIKWRYNLTPEEYAIKFTEQGVNAKFVIPHLEGVNLKCM